MNKNHIDRETTPKPFDQIDSRRTIFNDPLIIVGSGILFEKKLNYWTVPLFFHRWPTTTFGLLYPSHCLQLKYCMHKSFVHIFSVHLRHLFNSPFVLQTNVLLFEKSTIALSMQHAACTMPNIQLLIFFSVLDSMRKTIFFSYVSHIALIYPFYSANTCAPLHLQVHYQIFAWKCYRIPAHCDPMSKAILSSNGATEIS